MADVTRAAVEFIERIRPLVEASFRVEGAEVPEGIHFGLLRGAGVKIGLRVGPLRMRLVYGLEHTPHNGIALIFDERGLEESTMRDLERAIAVSGQRPVAVWRGEPDDVIDAEVPMAPPPGERGRELSSGEATDAVGVAIQTILKDGRVTYRQALETLLLDCLEISDRHTVNVSGYLRCRHCDAESQKDQPITHAAGCVVGQIGQMLQGGGSRV